MDAISRTLWNQPQAAPEMMLVAMGDCIHTWGSGPATEASMVSANVMNHAYKNSTLGYNWKRLIWGDLNCVRPNGSVQVFNPETKFMSFCFTAAVALGLTLTMMVPMALRFKELLRLQRGKGTILGQLSAVMALTTPLLTLYTGDREKVPAPIHIAVGTAGIFVALLSYIQDGRVAVSVPELLLYWLGAAFFYFGWALDSYLRFGLRASWNNVFASIFATLIFIFELWSPEREAQNRYDDTSVFARISMSYTERLMKKDSIINHDSIMDPPSGLDALSSKNEFTSMLAKYATTSRYRVVFALKDLLGGMLMLVVVLSVVGTLVTMSLPKVMEMFLFSLTTYSKRLTPIYESYYLALLLGVVPLVSLSFDILETVTANYAENKARSALMTVMYRKALHLSPAARERFEASKIMNMMSVDTQQVFMLAYNLPNLVALPVTLVLAVWQLWKFLGPSFLSAIFVYLCVIPLSTKLSIIIGALFPSLMKFKDERNKLTSNAFRCIKSLKLHAWERPFFERISRLRLENELRLIYKKVKLNIMISVAWNASGDFVAAAVFLTYLYLRVGALSPEVVFPSLVLLQNASGAILFFPQSLNSILLALNAQRRINELLLETEQDYANYYRISNEGAAGFNDSAIKLDKAVISWNGEDEESKIAIKEISFEATRGDLICIVGRVGSGKTALTRALCGDLAVLGGEVMLKGAVAYCSQDAWLQSYSVRDNIIFGQEYDQDWYDKVVDACELKVDIGQMPLGDQTEVGERGISLSGGQKARVSLARAVYSRADIVILDDILSAVDEHVSTALITKLFSSQGLLANRTIVLATNNVRVLSHSSLIIALQKKEVVEAISFKDVVAKGKKSLVYGLIEEFGHSNDLQQEAEHIVERKAIIEERERSNPSVFPPNVREKPVTINWVNIRREGDKKEEEEGDSNELKSMEVFWRYLIGGNALTFIVWLCILVFSTILTNFAIVYMGFMTSHNLETLYEARWYMTGYVLLNLSSAGFIVFSTYYIMTRIGLRNSKEYHDKMLWNVLHAPMSFFDVTPLGRLINRFSGDLATLDESIPTVFYYCLRSFINTLTVIGGIIIGSPVVIIAIIPLAWLANRSRSMYVPMQRKVVRIASAANSPILSHIEDSLKGQSTVRAFAQTSHFIDLFDQRVDYWVKAAFYSGNLTQWLGFRVQVLTTVLSLATALAVTQLISVGYFSTGYAAVILNFAQRAGVMVKQTIMFLAQAETSGVALERIFEYIDIKQEAAAVIEATQPSGNWPNSGEVTFHNLSARYAEDGPDILKNLSFTIKGGEKIGIVGRTGSGKSTLTLAIFRIIEAHQGHIEMDGVDTSILGLFDLRSRLSIIPQDAQIFDSSVRDNLDPLKTCDDAQLWEILDLCHLKEHFAGAQGLDTELTDSGSNLSRGQAQLLCLGRALVHHSKVLVLDEATASVDHETDRVVQDTIRKNFSDRTIITIAHRLNTIMDSDRIIVLDHGVIKEFDSPQNLLDMKGLFYSLYNSEQKDEEDEMNS